MQCNAENPFYILDYSLGLVVGTVLRILPRIFIIHFCRLKHAFRSSTKEWSLIAEAGCKSQGQGLPFQ